MYPARNAQNDQASCHVAGSQEMADAKRQRSRRIATGLWLSGIVLVAVAQGTQAGSTGNDEALTLSESSIAAQVSAGIRPLNSLDDTQLESIRGRYVDARALPHSAGDGGDFVILWDERPTGGGADTKSSLSSGLGNHQSTSVTTRREQ